MEIGEKRFGLNCEYHIDRDRDISTRRREYINV